MSASSIVVLGAGSIGLRHAKNLQSLGARVSVMDPDPARTDGLDVAAPYDLGRLADVDGVVLATPTTLHAEQTRQALASSPNSAVLVEKPLGVIDDDLADIVSTGNDRVMVGFNLRLHRPVERIAALVENGTLGTPLSYRFWFGSWLPDWRPGTDYRLCYSARSDLGGGVLLDAIHEIDLVRWIAGTDLHVIGAMVDRLGRLEIDVEDIVRALLTTPDGVPISVELDYLSRRYRRGIEVVGSDATARLDWARGVVEIETADDVAVEPATDPVDRSYHREAERFLDLIRFGTPPPVDARGGAAANDLVAEVMQVASSGRIAAGGIEP